MRRQCVCLLIVALLIFLAGSAGLAGRSRVTPAHSVFIREVCSTEEAAF